MFKKITTTIHPNIRKLIVDRKLDLLNSKGLETALTVPNEMITFLLAYKQSLNESKKFTNNEDLLLTNFKWLKSGYSENDRFRNVLRSSNRIQVVISAHIHNYLECKLLLYSKVAEETSTLLFYIDIQTGKIADLTVGCNFM